MHFVRLKLINFEAHCSAFDPSVACCIKARISEEIYDDDNWSCCIFWNSICFRGSALWGWHWLSFLVLGSLISSKVKWIEVKRSEFCSFHASNVGFVAFALCAMRGESNVLFTNFVRLKFIALPFITPLLTTSLHLNDNPWRSVLSQLTLLLLQKQCVFPWVCTVGAVASDYPFEFLGLLIS